MKKLVSLVLALCMVLTIGAAFAEPSANAKSVNVTGLDNGDEVRFYQIVEWVGEAEDNVTGWKATAAYKDILTKEVLTAVLIGDPNATPAVAKTGITPALANELAKAASGDPTPYTAAENKVTLPDAEPGIYMALVKPYKADTIYNPIFVSVDFIKGANSQEATTYADSTAKKSTLTLTKTAENTADYNGDHAQTTAVGDVVTFTVNTKIPAYGEVYTNPHFVLKDTLTDLALKTDSITVTGADADKYEVSATTSGYTITFKPAYLKTIKSATDITVTYQATVTSSALKAINEETNDVMIEYSHDPSNDEDWDVKKDTTQHYTFTIDASGFGEYTSLTGKKTSELIKIGLDGAGNPIHETVNQTEIVDDPQTWKGALEGAVFGLWKNAACEGDPYKQATTTADGRMQFSGLDAGTYYLKEISAPDGFVTNTTIHTVVLTASVDTVSVTEYYDPADGKWYPTNANGRKAATYDTEILKNYTVKVDDKDVASYTFTNESTSNSNEIKWTTLDPVELPCQLVNTKGTELPHTGGIGTTIFYILGGLLVVGAAVILVARRKAQD